MKTTSINEIIARVIRNIGYGKVPSTYFNSMIEWIAEGLRQMETSYCLVRNSEEVFVMDHRVFLPMNYQEMIAIEYQGNKLPLGSDITDITNQSSYVHQQPNRAPYNVFDTFDVVPQIEFERRTPLRNADYYIINGGCINTSFEKGKIKIHYWALDTDNEGYPTVPDVESAKTALYWYVLSMLIGSGFKHEVFDYNMCFQQYEKIYLPRAINELMAWTPEHAARALGSQVRLVMPYHAPSDFFVNQEHAQEIVTHRYN